MADTKISATAGATGGAALPTGDTTTYLRRDQNYAQVIRRAASPGVAGETFPRHLASGTSAAMTSGTAYAVAIDLDLGVTVTNIGLLSLTAESGGTHAWAGLADSGMNLLAVSADHTGAAYFAANTAVTTALSSPYTTTRAGLFYVVVCVVAGTTVPTFASAPALAHANLSAVVPIACGSSSTGQTTPPAVGTALTALTATAGHVLYAWLT